MSEPAGLAQPVVPPHVTRLGDVGPAGLPLLYDHPGLSVGADLWARLGAGFRDNLLGALVSMPGGPTFYQSGFDAAAAAQEVQLPEERRWLAGARNQQEFDLMVQHAMQRRRDRAIALQEPLLHQFFSMGTDPTNFVFPGAAWIRAGGSAGAAMLRGAVTQGLVTVGAEGLRMAADPTVPLSEAQGAVVGGTVMGALIGRMLRPSSPLAIGAGRYLEGATVDAAALARGEGPAFLRGEEVPGSAPPRGPRPGVYTIPPGDEVGAFEAAGAAGTPRGMVGQSGDFQPAATGLWLERLRMTPVMRLLQSPVDAVGEAIQTLTQTPFFTRGNQRGVVNPGNVASDQFRWHSAVAHALEDYQQAYLEHRGVGQVRATVQDLTRSRPAGVLNDAEFGDRVWRRLHAQADDALPEVNRAAAALRRDYDEMGDEAAKAGFFDQSTVRMPRRWETLFGDVEEGYVNRVWNKAAIEADRAGAEAAVKDWLARTGRDVGRAKEIVDGILTDRPFRGIDDTHVGQASSAYRRKFDAPSVPFQKYLITDPRELLAHYARTMGPDISLGIRAGGVDARGLIDNASKAWFEQIGVASGTDGAAIWQRHQTELKRIQTEVEKRYRDLQDAAEAAGIGDPRIEDVAALRTWGDSQRAMAAETAQRQLGAHGTPHEALWKRMNSEIEDIKAVRDILRGTYGQWDDSMAVVPRVLAAARKVAMMNSLTGVVSQLSDVGALALKEGFTRTFGTAFAGLRAGLDTIKLAGEEARRAGTALEMMNSSRAMALFDLAPDISGRHSVFERALDRAAQVTFHLNLMNPWSQFAKNWASLVVGDRIAADVATVAAGVPRAGIAKQLGEHLADQERIFQQIGGRQSPTGAPTGQALQSLLNRQQQLAAAIDALGPVSAHERLLARLERARQLGEPTAAIEQQIRAGEAAAAGDVGTAARTRLARAGISEDQAVAIAAQMEHHGRKAEGVTVANTRDWTDAKATAAFRRALAEDIENAIISADGPGRSLWLSRPLGQTIGMFHAYGQAAITKLLVPALQEKDARLLSGVALMVGAGAISDWLRRQMTGQHQELSTGEQLWRAIDRSGVTGWFGQLFQAASGLTDSRHGPAFAGAETPAPSMLPIGLSANGVVRALGPVGQNAHDLIDAGFRAGTMDWGPRTARDMLRLLPLQKVTHMHFAFSELERSLGAIGRNEAEPTGVLRRGGRHRGESALPALAQ